MSKSLQKTKRSPQHLEKSYDSEIFNQIMEKEKKGFLPTAFLIGTKNRVTKKAKIQLVADEIELATPLASGLNNSDIINQGIGPNPNENEKKKTQTDTRGKGLIELAKVGLVV